MISWLVLVTTKELMEVPFGARNAEFLVLISLVQAGPGLEIRLPAAVPDP